jgi:predicted secreted protein
MASHMGKEGSVKIGSNAVAEVKSWNIEESADLVDTTTLDNTSGWKTSKAAFKSWSGSLECLWDETNNNGQGALTSGASVALSLYPEGSATTYFSGTAIVTGIKRSASHDGMVEASFDFTGNGALTLATA